MNMFLIMARLFQNIIHYNFLFQVLMLISHIKFDKNHNFSCLLNGDFCLQKSKVAQTNLLLSEIARLGRVFLNKVLIGMSTIGLEIKPGVLVMAGKG